MAEAVETAVAKLKSDDAVDDQWAKPLIDEAISALNRAEGTPWTKGAALGAVKAKRAGGA